MNEADLFGWIVRDKIFIPILSCIYSSVLNLFSTWRRVQGPERNQEFQWKIHLVFERSRDSWPTVKPLITNTLIEFIKCCILHFLIMDWWRYCCNLERIRNTLEFMYIFIYRHIYLEHAASALYNESKQKETGVHKEP